MIKLEILHEFTRTTSFGIVDKISEYNELRHVFESRSPTLFIFLSENILRSNLNLSSSYDRSTDL